VAFVPVPAAVAAPAAPAARTRPAGTLTPHLLPPPAGTARSAAAATPASWLVGARPGGRSQAIAARHGARLLTPRGIFQVTTSRARAFARDLRRAHRYRFSEPNRTLPVEQAPAGGDDVGATDWRQFLVPGLAAPPAQLLPLTAAVDTPADPTHPDLAGIQFGGTTDVRNEHGTAIASVIGGRANGLGMVGMVPNAPVLSIGTTPLEIGPVIVNIAAAVQQKARVINLSLGTLVPSYALLLEISYAASQDVLVVASAGNDAQTALGDGTVNPVVFPAAFPHVLSVASMGSSGASSFFSTSNGAVDVSAPGESVLAAVPPAYDADGTVDGYSHLWGTSLAAPIVSGAAAWLMADGRKLTADQVAELLRATAVDLGEKGWDPNSGYGLIDVRRALRSAAPASDPSEVNDDIEWVDGRRIGKPDSPLFAARDRRVAIAAVVDYWEDPADVYRVEVPRRSRVRLVLRTQRDADPDLAAFNGRATSIYTRRGRIGISLRGPGRADAVVIRNRSGRTRSYYAVVYSPARDAQRIDAPYTLTAARRR
jgi:subtilisin family serine protease